jgi:hypothetical protein
MGNQEKTLILVTQKWQSFKQYLGSRHTIRKAKYVDLWVPFDQPAKVLEHELLQIFDTHILSTSPTLQPKYIS